MSYTRGIVGAELLSFSTHGRGTVLDVRAVAGTGAWPTTNLAIYVPVVVSSRCVVLKLAIGNGTSISGNLDLGLYNASGTRLVSSGSTAHSGSADDFIVDVTNTTIGPGLYYLAACFDNTTATVGRTSPAAPIPLANGVLTEALGSVTLPATATWAANQTLAYIPFIMALLEPTATL